MKTAVFDGKSHMPQERYLLLLGLPLGLGMGVVLAYLIIKGYWTLAVALAIVAPSIIVLLRYPLRVVLLWILLMSFLPVETVSPPVFWVMNRALLPLALGSVILSRALRLNRGPLPHWGLAELAMVLYLAVGVVSILATQSAPVLSLFELYDKVFVPFIVYWLVRLSVPSEQDLKGWVPVLLIVCAAQIAIGFLARYAPQALPSLWIFPRMGDRMSGTFNNPNAYAYTLLFFMAFLLYAALNQRGRFTQAVVFVTFGLGMVCVFLTFTRACWLAGLVIMIGLMLLYPRSILSLLTLGVPIAIILLASVFSSEVTIAFGRLGTEGTVDDRTVLLHAGEQMFTAKPLLGWGYNTYNLYDWKFIERVGDAAPSRWDVESGSSHNTYMTILAETGIIGFLLYSFPIIWWLALSIKTLRRLSRQGFWNWRLLTVLWLSVSSYILIAQIIDMRWFWYSNALFWLTLGLIANIVLINSTSGERDALYRPVSPTRLAQPG
jgi:O-antigen ligase